MLKIFTVWISFSRELVVPYTVVAKDREDVKKLLKRDIGEVKSIRHLGYAKKGAKRRVV
jgi:hypothetical protein